MQTRSLEDENERLRAERERETSVVEPSRALTSKLQVERGNYTREWLGAETGRLLGGAAVRLRVLLGVRGGYIVRQKWLEAGTSNGGGGLDC